jgi:plastocyanin
MLLLFGLALFADSALSQDTTQVKVMGMGVDARFDPILTVLNSGDVVVFSVLEGTHTVTAYHPDNRRPDRIPKGVSPFDSGMLQKGDTWTLQLRKKGVYDYFCLPHERMGHVGRIIVGQSRNETKNPYSNKLLPAIAQEVYNSLNDNPIHNQ